MNNVLRDISVVVFIVSQVGVLAAQNLANLADQNPITLSGGLRVSSQFYSVSGIDPQRSPFAWRISGSPTLSIYGISLPLSFSFNGRETNLNYPTFNRFGASPHYKWIKVHAGYRNMRFSEYTFSGKTFLGAGVELTPGNFRFSAMVGRLRNLAAIRNRDSYLTNLVPDYRRKAFALKIGYGSPRNYFDLILFRSVDDPNDYLHAIDDRAIRPIENLVFGTQSRFTIAKRITFDLNGAASALSDDINAETVASDHTIVKAAEPFFKPRKSSALSLAGDASLNLRLSRFSFGVKYQRIEPFFQSFGTNYYNSDRENITINAGTNFVKRKIRLNGSFGIERNDLQNIRATKSKRSIGSLMLSITPSNEWSLNLRYANYQRENQSGLLELNDTLRFVNVSQQSGISFNYRIGDEQIKYRIGLTANLQTIEDQSAIRRLSSDVMSYNTALNFGIDLKNLGLNITPSANYSRHDVSEAMQERYGFGLRANKKFPEDFSVSLSSRYNWNDYNKLSNGKIFTTRINMSKKILSSHRLGFTISYVDRSSILRKSFQEIRSRLNYGYTF